MNGPAVLDRPTATASGSLLPAGLIIIAVVFVLFLGSRLQDAFQGGRVTSDRDVKDAEGALRELVGWIGRQLEERGISDEDELDTAIAQAKHEAYKHRYPSSGRSTA